MAGKKNIEIEKWSTFKLKATYRSASKKIVDLSFCTAKAQFRETATSAAVLLELSTENGKIQPLSKNGIISIILTAAETGALTFPNAVYDLVITFANGEPLRVLEGKVTVIDGVTR